MGVQLPLPQPRVCARCKDSHSVRATGAPAQTPFDAVNNDEREATKKPPACLNGTTGLGAW